MQTVDLRRPKTLVAEGFYFGVDQTALQQNFDPSFPYSYCRICGWLYQPPSQRHEVPPKLQLPNAVNDSAKKRDNRRRACDKHAAHHTDAEKKSVGEFSFLPEATHRLAAFGIAPLSQIAQDLTHKQAASEASRFEVNNQDDIDRLTLGLVGVPSQGIVVPRPMSEGHIKSQLLEPTDAK